MATRRMSPEEEKSLRELTRAEERRLAQELWEHRDDPDEWEDEPTDFVVAANPGVVYSVRFTGPEFHQISDLADRKGLTIDELIKTLLAPETSAAPKPKRTHRKVRA